MKKDVVLSEKELTQKGEIQKNRLEKLTPSKKAGADTTVRPAAETSAGSHGGDAAPDRVKSLNQKNWTQDSISPGIIPAESGAGPDMRMPSRMETNRIPKSKAATAATVPVTETTGARPREMQAFIEKVIALEVRKKHVVKSAAVISNKGGVGKTHIANNMSFYMSRLGKKVLTIDLDLGNADITNKLGFYCKNTIIDLFNGTREVDQLIYTTPYGFDLIAGESGNFKLANLTSAHKNRFIKALRRVSTEYDYVIYDLSAGIASTTLDFALAQDYQIVITTPQDIISGYSCIKAAYFRFQEVEKAMAKNDPSYKARKTFRPFVIINQVSDFASGRALFEKIASVSKENIKGDKDFHLDINLLGVITSDPIKIREVELKNQLYSNSYGASKTGQCFHFLSHNMMQYRDPNNIEFKTKFKRFVNLFMKGIDEFKYAQ